MSLVPWDFVPGDCNCEFSPDPSDPDEESFHYLRACLQCGHRWYALHCPHDRVQKPCPECGLVPKPKEGTFRFIDAKLIYSPTDTQLTLAMGQAILDSANVLKLAREAYDNAHSERMVYEYGHQAIGEDS